MVPSISYLSELNCLQAMLLLVCTTLTSAGNLSSNESTVCSRTTGFVENSTQFWNKQKDHLNSSLHDIEGSFYYACYRKEVEYGGNPLEECGTSVDNTSNTIKRGSRNDISMRRIDQQIGNTRNKAELRYLLKLRTFNYYIDLNRLFTRVEMWQRAVEDFSNYCQNSSLTMERCIGNFSEAITPQLNKVLFDNRNGLRVALMRTEKLMQCTILGRKNTRNKGHIAIGTAMKQFKTNTWSIRTVPSCKYGNIAACLLWQVKHARKVQLATTRLTKDAAKNAHIAGQVRDSTRRRPISMRAKAS